MGVAKVISISCTLTTDWSMAGFLE